MTGREIPLSPTSFCDSVPVSSEIITVHTYNFRIVLISMLGKWDDKENSEKSDEVSYELVISL
jgi:hypothetical protein